MSRIFKVICCLIAMAFLAWPLVAAAEYIPPKDPRPYVVDPAPVSPNLDVIKRGEESMKAQVEKINAAMNRRAEEAAYFQRGVTLDFLNKPIKLFELTCTTKADGTQGITSGLIESFKFSQQQWTEFCATKGKKAVKCAFGTLLKNLWQQQQDKLIKFKDQSFCSAFTDFINNQLNQCITIRLNLPRGKFPGFQALNQCMFGRLNINVNPEGKLVTADGEIMQDVVSINSFKYKTVNMETRGFGGSEKQLLGPNGLSSLMEPENWGEADSGGPVAGGSCGNLDPNLVNILNEYANRGDGNPANAGMYLNPLNPQIHAWKPDANANGGADWQMIATWVENKERNQDIYLMPPTGGGKISWAPDGKYTYLAKCYGFEMYKPAIAVCGTPGNNPAFEEQYCENLADSEFCCDPDETDCVANEIFLPPNYCTDGTKASTVNMNGVKKAICLKPGTKVAPPGTVALCTNSCCDPSKNDCALIGSKICDKYIPPATCVAATPAQRRQYDPVYSILTPMPDTVVGGRTCCSSQWCNLCPQDLFAAANGELRGNHMYYVKSSELADVPEVCLNRVNTVTRPTGPRGTRTANSAIDASTTTSPRGGESGTGADPIKGTGAQLTSVSDSVFENTMEACALLNDQGWKPAEIEEAWITCPKKRKQNETSSKLFDPLNLASGITSIGIQFVTGTSNCPEGTEAKPYIPEVVNFNICNRMINMSRYPAPITKITRIEGQQPIGLCSELELCPAGVSAAENPGGRERTCREGDSSWFCMLRKGLVLSPVTSPDIVRPTGPLTGGNGQYQTNNGGLPATVPSPRTDIPAGNQLPNITVPLTQPQPQPETPAQQQPADGGSGEGTGSTPRSERGESSTPRGRLY